MAASPILYSLRAWILLGSFLPAPAFLPTARGEMLMHLVFDDPQALLSSHPDGLHHLAGAFASSKATIASGSGGRALPQITAGPASEPAATTPEVTFQTASAPALGAGPFFRASLQGGSTTRQAGVGIFPEASASLATLVTREGGFVRASGGWDFLFRVSSPADYPKMNVMTKLGPLGIQAGLDPKDGRLILRLSTPGRSLDTNGDRSGDRNVLEKRSEGSVENGGIYHGALVVHTADDNALTVAFFVTEGPGPLDPATALSASVEGVWVLDEPQKDNAEKIVITLGRNETGLQTLDLAAFRIFHPVPPRFPEFGAAER